MVWLVVLLALLFIFGGAGYYGHSRYNNYYGYSPAVVIFIILVFLLLTGGLH